MFLFATLWAAALNLLLLCVALAWTPAFWSDAPRWLQALPWGSFGTQALALPRMQAVDATAVWALWLCVSAVLLLGALASYALLKWRAPLPAVLPPPTPKVAALLGQLSGSLQGLQGFGGLNAPAAAPPTPQSVPVLTRSAALATAKPATAPSHIAASLQDIDPELGSSYDAVLRELIAAKPNR